jgi:hypothetical protein
MRDNGLRSIANLQISAYEGVHKGDWSVLDNEIHRLKNDPNVLMYHLFDEDPTDFGPSGRVSQLDTQAWQTVYNRVKAIDPTRIVYPNNISSDHACTYIPLGGTTPTYDFRPYSDLWSMDAYEVFTSTTDLESIVRLHDSSIQNCRATTGVNKPYMFITQTYQDLVNHRVRPTRQQMRSYVYSAIAHGATAIGYFSFHSTWAFSQPPNGGPPWYVQHPNGGSLSPELAPDLWAEIGIINREIEANKKAFLTRTSDIGRGLSRLHQARLCDGAPPDQHDAQGQRSGEHEVPAGHQYRLRAGRRPHHHGSRDHKYHVGVRWTLRAVFGGDIHGAIRRLRSWALQS